MKLNSYFACLPAALLLAACSLAAEKDITTKSFPVQAGGKLVMNVDRGSIKVNASGSDKVDVKIVRELRRGSDSTARDVYARHKIDMEQNGDTVNISVERPAKGLGLFSNPFNHLHVEYTISVPAEFNLDVRTAGGNIDVSDLKGEVRANTAGGNLNLGSINGPINAQTSGGNINVAGGKGDSLLRTSGGNVKLHDLEGDLTAKTSGGNISIERVRGAIRAETSGGHIKIEEAHGPVFAHTSGGNVSANLMQQPASKCELSTSGGHVAVTLAQIVGVNLDARTSGGSIRSDFPGEMNKHRTKLAAQVNGGGPELVLQTSGGNVEIRKK
jgi:DUF4097 and DUF4098 domain-containing protein YvlB